MPRRPVMTRDMIVDEAVALVREKGVGELNARSLASRLSSSTQPIFSNFRNMAELERAVIDKAASFYFAFLENRVKEGRYPVYKAMGMGYIDFARREGNLFRLLFMSDRKRCDYVYPTDDSSDIVSMISSNTGLSLSSSSRLQKETWFFVHGIATLIATSYMELSEEEIANALTDMYEGILCRLKKEDEDEDDRQG